MAARGAMWWVGGYGADMEGTALGVGVMVERPDGGLDYSHVAAPMLSPTFLARRGDHLYAAAEGAGRVQSFFIAAETLTTDEVTDEELERAPEFDELGADADENEDTREGRA